jgi:hypothetical protein
MDAFAVFGIGGTGIFDMLCLIKYEKFKMVSFQCIGSEFGGSV